MKTITFALFASAMLFLFVSCDKEEGPGGLAKITGSVMVKNYNSDFTKFTTSWAQDEKVFLMYGNDTIHSDKTETSYNGNFMFEYLREGDYTLFVYSEDSTKKDPSALVPVIVNISISGKDAEVKLPVITILKTHKGVARIVGNVWVRDYNADFTRLIASYWAEEEDVYLMYGNDTVHFDKTETSYNGNFVFEKLQEGDYTVFSYSKDSTLNLTAYPTGRVPVIKHVTITQIDETAVVPTITIFK